MGCGTGQLLEDIFNTFKDQKINLTGVDISKKMLLEAKNKDIHATYYQSGIEEFDNHKYDIITCTHSFPYYKDKKEAVNTFHKLLNEEGYLLMAQASTNSLYDRIILFFVKFFTGKGKYPSVKDVKDFTKDKFTLDKVIKIKKKFYMPSIYLFVLKKKWYKS